MLVCPAQPGGADRLLRLPVDAEILRREARVGARLPVRVWPRRTNEVHPVAFPTRHQQRGVHVAGIDDVGAGQAGQAVALLERVMDDWRGRGIDDGAGSRDHLGDEARGVFLARLGEVHLVARRSRTQVVVSLRA